MNSRAKIGAQDFNGRWRRAFSRRRRRHDPLLVFNLAIFSSPGERRRIFATSEQSTRLRRW